MNDNKNQTEQLLNGAWQLKENKTEMIIINIPRYKSAANSSGNFTIDWFVPAETWRVFSDYFLGYSCFLIDINEKSFSVAAYESGTEDTVTKDGGTGRFLNAVRIFNFNRIDDAV